MTGETSDVLIRRCAGSVAERASRDAAPWDELVRRHAATLRRAVTRALRAAGERAAPEEVEEHLQEVWCALLERDRDRLRRFRGSSEGEAVTYLARVAHTVVLDGLRARRARKRGAYARFVAAEVLTVVPDRAPGPEERCLAGERRALLLERCDRALAGGRRERDLRVLRLALLEGWTSREISAELGGAMGVGAIDALLHRTRRRLGRDGLAVPSR